MNIGEFVTAISKTKSAVGVVGILFVFLTTYIFSDEIISLFGSEKMFYLTVLLIVVFFIALLIAILFKKPEVEKAQIDSKPIKKDIKVTYDKGSTHNGDNNF
jgi:hypothetical protein